MFNLGDKVIDSHTHQIGTISKILIDEKVLYPITVSFPSYICTYTSSGQFITQEDSRYIKKVEDMTGIVKVSSTHICISFNHSTLLLPIALTSFNIVNDIIIATYNGKEYAMCTDNIAQVIEQLLNPTKKESL